MNKLTNEQQDRRAELVRQIKDAGEGVKNATEAYNRELACLIELHLTPAVEAYNAATEAAVEFARDIGAKITDAYQNKPQSFQDSDKGQAFEDWGSEWDNFEPDELELETHDPIREPDLPDAEQLEMLPIKPADQ